VLPRIQGRAWVYGMHQIGVDPDDPLADGFMLSDTWGSGFPTPAREHTQW
jgi:proline racemase